MFKVEIMSNEDREWHESFSLVLGPDDPVEAVLGELTTTTVTILDQEAAGSLILPAPPIVSRLTQAIGQLFLEQAQVKHDLPTNVEMRPEDDVHIYLLRIMLRKKYITSRQPEFR